MTTAQAANYTVCGVFVNLRGVPPKKNRMQPLVAGAASGPGTARWTSGDHFQPPPSTLYSSTKF